MTPPELINIKPSTSSISGGGGLNGGISVQKVSVRPESAIMPSNVQVR
jgi:hypothetical protein